MKNKITNLKISNFKSIKEAELECGRINLFVGKPNVGKSNVLEALSLLGASYSKNEKFMSEFVRYEEMSNWFFDQKIESNITIETNIGSAVVSNVIDHNEFKLFLGDLKIINSELALINNNGESFIAKHKDNMIPEIGTFETTLNSSGNKKGPTIINSDKKSPVKLYLFEKSNNINEIDRSYLLPPDGKNLLQILISNRKLLEEIQTFFEEYNLKIIFDPQKGTIEILKELSRSAFIKHPYISIADTLQRMIFHYAAIFSNKDSVILFEEPESHSFPPYIRELALQIVESTENQFFITTHSPHLFITIVEETKPEDLAIFITYFENYETKFKKLNTDDINELLNYGIDIFFNQKWFMNEKSAENPA